MDIIELSADDTSRVADVVQLRNAVQERDAPWTFPTTVRSVQGWMRYGWDLEPSRMFGGYDGAQLVAIGMVNTSEWDNLDLAWLDLTIHPDFRGQGHEDVMYEHIEQLAQSLGRTKLGIDAWDGSKGIGFVEQQGFTVASKAINRRQHLDEVPIDKIGAMNAEAAAAASAYELMRVVGRTPEEMLDDVSVMTAAINDAPLDDLEIDDEVFPPQRIRDYETAIEGRGERMYRLLARHRETGELAGHTIVAVEGEHPERGHQHDTTVVRSHRGHRLGMLLKTEMNLWLAELEPQLRTVDTWNAESNDHMIGVNEALGYRWMARAVSFQKSLPSSSGAVA